MLGPLEAWHAGEPVPLGDQQQRFVLVVLLLHANRPVSAERLTEIVWGEKAERRTLVRGYINKLRKAFANADDVTIETTPTGYTLRVDADRIDAARFERLRDEATSAGDSRRAVELLRAATGLWQGRFLEDIDHDRVGGTAVVDLNESYLDAVGDLAELELRAGEHRSARDRLRRAIRLDPARQKLAELLMRALVAGGDRVGAIRVFQETAEALAEYDMEPGPVLRNLAARAERGEPASSLPSRPGGFTGRHAELAAIDAVAEAAGERRSVWISGLPGAGKTGLAIEAAHRLRDRFPDGQVLVRLNGHTPNVTPATTGDALTALLTELGVPPEQIPATDGRKSTLYQTELYGTRTLVVLDNAASAEQVRPLLPEAPGCLAVVTSRRMGAPDTGTPIRLTPLPPADADALFRALTDPARLRGRSAEVAGVVKRCGYLPMPIRVAAALLRRHVRWPLEHLLALLEDSRPWREDPDAAVRVSYEQLDAPHQELFRLLGHLPGPDVAVAGAAALAGRDLAWARKVLDELHEVCLLEETTPERYRMLDPLKEFAAAEPSATSTALTRLLDHYLVTLTRAVAAAYPFDRELPSADTECPVSPAFADASDALAWIDAERDNVVAAIHCAAERGLTGHVWRLAVLIWRHSNTTNQLEDWIETLELARSMVADDDRGHAHVLLRLATAHNRLGRLAEALALAESALPIWTRLGDARGEAATLCAIGIPTMELGEPGAAVTRFETALAKYEQVGDLRGQAHALSMLGFLDEQNGAYAKALRRHEAAVPMLREIRHAQGLAHALNNLGCVQQRLGRAENALASHVEAQELAGELGDDCVLAYALNNIGNVHRSRDELTDAVRYHERAKAVAAAVSDPDLLTQLHHDRAATARACGRQADALRGYQAALDLASSTGNRGHQAHAHHGIAQVLHTTGRHTDAAAHWRAAASEFTALGQPDADTVAGELADLRCACAAQE